jgi:hypothetical protein
MVVVGLEFPEMVREGRVQERPLAQRKRAELLLLACCRKGNKLISRTAPSHEATDTQRLPSTFRDAYRGETFATGSDNFELDIYAAGEWRLLNVTPCGPRKNRRFGGN